MRQKEQSASGSITRLCEARAVAVGGMSLRAEEVASLLRLRPSTVADSARTGDLPSVKLGRARRHVWADVRAYVQRLCEQGGHGRMSTGRLA
jgi:excisionase family DNA binding protein